MKHLFALPLLLVVVSACSGSSSAGNASAAPASSSAASGQAGDAASQSGSSQGGAATSQAGGASSLGGASGAASSGGTISGGASGGASLAGAGSGAASGAGAAAGGAPPWDLWIACTVDEDCTVVPIQSCCGCADTGVNRAHAADALATNASFHASECGAVGCATQGCALDARAACELGRCVPKPGCSARDEASCASDGTCEPYRARLCSRAGDFAFFTCGKPKAACAEASLCRISPAGLSVLFPDSCVPDGYTQACSAACQ